MTIVDATLDTVTRRSPTAAATPRPSKAGRMTWRPPTQVIAKTAYASTRWNSGATWSQQSPPWMRCSLRQPAAWSRTTRRASTTPLGRPDVPDV